MLRRHLLLWPAASLAGCQRRDLGRMGAHGDAIRLSGAGASLPAALWSSWANSYASIDGRVEVTYQATSSGDAPDAISTRKAAFAATDAPLTKDALSAAGLLMLPATLSSVAVIYNLSLPQPLRLTGDALARIFLGQITTWDNAILRACNPGVTLPSIEIRPIFRKDPSGTTTVMSELLARRNADWKRQVGVVPSFTGKLTPHAWVQNTSELSSLLQGTRGAISFVSYNQAFNSQAPPALLDNQAGRFLPPLLEYTANAASAIDDLDASPIDAPGEASYPLVALSFVLAPTRLGAAHRKGLQRFLGWCLREGQRFAPPLGFATLPAALTLRAEGALRALG